MKSKIFIIFLCILTCGYYYGFFFNKAYVELEIEVDEPTKLKIYWEKKGANFTEKKRVSVPVVPEKEHYEFFLTDINSFDKLRIDPVQYEGRSRIKKISISQKRYKTINIDFGALQPLNDIVNYSVEDGTILVYSGGIDPNFLYLPEFERDTVNWFQELFLLLVLVIFVILVTKNLSPLRNDFGYVPVMLAMVLILIVTMAYISKRNAHPDEYVHLAATDYYQEHWLPPEVNDEAIRNTYSVYGSSRLNNGEIYYLFAGKVSKIVELFKIKKPFSLRIFNVLLFFVIFLYTIRCLPARAVALPFLISPQIWYIFSYCGSDAFGLFLCFFAGCQLVNQDSFFNRMVYRKATKKHVVSILLASFLLAMLFLLKKNYYPFIAFFYVCLFWKLFKIENHQERISFITKICIVTVAALVLAGFRVGLDYYVNGLDRQEKLAVIEEQTAHEWYKPSTPLENQHVSLYMKARGTELKTLIFKYKWFEKTFYSGFGLYGYFSIAASEGYYNLVRWASSALLAYLFLIFFIRGRPEDIGLLFTATLLSLALVGVSLYHSWTMDFQAQGRYLFPILPMIGIMLGRGYAYVNTRLMVLGLSQLFLLGLYSFIFIALVNIAR